MKNYHLKPWELQDFTLPECSLMLLALDENPKKGVTSHKDDDPTSKEITAAKMQKIIDEAIAYKQLSPQEQLDIALKDYRRE